VTAIRIKKRTKLVFFRQRLMRMRMVSKRMYVMIPEREDGEA